MFSLYWQSDIMAYKLIIVCSHLVFVFLNCSWFLRSGSVRIDGEDALTIQNKMEGIGFDDKTFLKSKNKTVKDVFGLSSEEEDDDKKKKKKGNIFFKKGAKDDADGDESEDTLQMGDGASVAGTAILDQFENEFDKLSDAKKIKKAQSLQAQLNKLNLAITKQCQELKGSIYGTKAKVAAHLALQLMVSKQEELLKAAILAANETNAKSMCMLRGVTIATAKKYKDANKEKCNVQKVLTMAKQ